MPFAIIAISFAFVECNSGNEIDNAIDYSGIKAKEAAFIEKFESEADSVFFIYWWTEDKYVDEFIQILKSERRAAMKYEFDSLVYDDPHANFMFSSDSMVREFQFVNGSGFYGYTLAILYDNGDSIKVFIPTEEDVEDMVYFSLDYFFVEKDLYLYRGYIRCGQYGNHVAYLADFSGDTIKRERIAESYCTRDDNIRQGDSVPDQIVWDDEKKCMLLALPDDENVWHGEYVKYQWNGKSFVEMK